MSQVIEFLEGLGRGSIVGSRADDYASLVAELDIEFGQRQALLDRDPSALSDSLFGRAVMVGFIATPSPTPDDGDQDLPDGDDDPFPDQEGPPSEQK